MTVRALATAGLMLLAGTTGVLAEEIVCTPEFYYNTSAATPQIIPIDKPRLAGSRITSIDLDTGAFHDNMGASDGRLLERGMLRVVNPGSMQERIDFVALNPKTGLLLHISFVDQGTPFTRVDTEGTVASGHCAYEVKQ